MEHLEDISRDCLHQCGHVGPALDAPDENPTIIHWKVSRAGYNYYFCATHRVYHCMFTDVGLDQPFCGECAPIYYYSAINVVWMKDQDWFANFNGAEEMAAAAARKLVAINLSLQAIRIGGDQHAPGGSSDSEDSEASSGHPGTPIDLFALPEAHSLPRNETDIPRDDIIYRALGNVLIAHRRQDDMFLLPFYGYQGAIGYMPCSLNIDRSSLFLTFAQHEEHGDPIFKSARVWACKYQGIPNLPRDIRWVLWNIYMLANEALAHVDESEAAIWRWRGWLWHFYSLADELFEVHHIAVASPEEDWFSRPATRNAPAPPPASDEDEDDVLGGQNNTPVTSAMSDLTDLLEQLPCVDGINGDNTNNFRSGQSQRQSETSAPETVLHHASSSSSTEVTAEGVPTEVDTNQQEITDDETSSSGEDTPDEDTDEED
ncbi:gtpase-activator for ras gtpase [Trichoderma arundinaceum]|uniref:Gtpase-activator for ras gtpase n=1 Tax=Trichoderma arundinaceum TaxID=490622 RepID=A0A395NJH3_TRIAR|nr:gtpase-activator for ras gtpase [Trichoderma arundinaceum]